MGIDVVDGLAEELVSNPKRFRSKGGYERLVDALNHGSSPSNLEKTLASHPELAGDLLWALAEADNVDKFVTLARPHLSSHDNGTAAYAMEIVLRGGRDDEVLRKAFHSLRNADTVVCEHAVRVLSEQGASRLWEVLRALGDSWAATLARRSPDQISSDEVEVLLAASSRDRQVVGAASLLLWRSRATRPMPTFLCEPGKSGFANTDYGCKRNHNRDIAEIEGAADTNKPTNTPVNQ